MTPRAQLLPWSRDARGSLLVLGTGNVDEALRGCAFPPPPWVFRYR
jgi:hypothetical protein